MVNLMYSCVNVIPSSWRAPIRCDNLCPPTYPSHGKTSLVYPCLSKFHQMMIIIIIIITIMIMLISHYVQTYHITISRTISSLVSSQYYFQNMINPSQFHPFLCLSASIAIEHFHITVHRTIEENLPFANLKPNIQNAAWSQIVAFILTRFTYVMKGKEELLLQAI